MTDTIGTSRVNVDQFIASFNLTEFTFSIYIYKPNTDENQSANAGLVLKLNLMFKCG